MTDDRKDRESGTPSWQLPQERQPETDAYHIWTPRPLLRSVYWKPVPAPPFEAISATYEIFVDQRAWLTMHEHVWQTPADKTPFGYLIGDLCEDPNANRRFVSITAALPARFNFREEQSDQISREATLALQLEVERRRGVLAGWYHRHIGGEIALSEADVATHHRHFPEPWQCAFMFVGGGDRCEGGCFRSTPEKFAGDLLLPFYEMASNESLLARGLKRSYLDWTNYATVDEVRSEPPSRPTLPEPWAAEPAAAPESEAAAPEPERPSEAPGPPMPEPSAPEQGRTADVPAEPQPPAASSPSREDLDFDALIDEVKTARIGGEDEEAGDAARPEETMGAPAPDAEVKPKPRIIPEPRITPEPPRPPEPAGAERGTAKTGAADAKAAAPAARTDSASGTRRRREPVVPGEAPNKSRSTLTVVAVGAMVLIVAIVAGALIFGQDPSGGADAGGAGRAEDPGVIDPSAGGGAEGAVPAAADSAADARVTVADMERAVDSLQATISRFYGQAVARDLGDATCEDLAAAYVQVENEWIEYNAEYKARFTGDLPEELAVRDQRLYAGVQDSEREYERSGCPRP